MQLYFIKFYNGETLFIKEDEYDDFAKAMALLSIQYTAKVITEPMYAIHWYDYIDEEWHIIWCTKDNFNTNLAEVKDAKVEYYIKEYN